MPKIFSFLIFSALIIIVDLYAWQAVKLLLENSAPMMRRYVTYAYWAIPAIAFALLVAGAVEPPAYWPQWIRVYGIAIIVLFYISKVIMLPFLAIDDIVRLTRWVSSSFSPSDTSTGGISRQKFIVYSGLLISGVLGLNLIWGMVRNAYRYRLHRVSLKIKELPASMHNLKIVQLSDIHSGSFVRTEPIREAIDKINAMNPDLILFTGDLVNNIAEEVNPFKEIFGNLRAKYGVYSVMGNHDYGDYVVWNNKEERDENLKRLHTAHADMGWKLLLNESVLIGEEEEKLALIGVENWSALARFPKYGKLEQAVLGTEEAKVKILLSHDPTHWESQVLHEDYKDIHLTLSGHTHGFQFGVEIPGLKWSPSQYVYKQWAGLYQRGEQYLYVNRGFGFLGYPGRVGILPEITLIELQTA